MGAGKDALLLTSALWGHCSPIHLRGHTVNSVDQGHRVNQMSLLIFMFSIFQGE